MVLECDLYKNMFHLYSFQGKKKNQIITLWREEFSIPQYTYSAEGYIQYHDISTIFATNTCLKKVKICLKFTVTKPYPVSNGAFPVNIL